MIIPLKLYKKNVFLLISVINNLQNTLLRNKPPAVRTGKVFWN